MRPVSANVHGIVTRMAAANAALLDLDGLDVEALKALIIEQHTELTFHKAEIENLKLLILKLRRMQFGRRSEKLDRKIEQLELKLEDLEAAQASLPQSAEEEPAPFQQRRRSGRKPLPPELPREIETLEPAEEVCPDCGGALAALGADVSETLEYEPGYFKVIRTVRPKRSCTGCDRIVQQPAPHRPN